MDKFDLAWEQRSIKLRNEMCPDRQRHYRRENILHLMHEFKRGKIDLATYNLLMSKEYKAMPPTPPLLLTESQQQNLQNLSEKISEEDLVDMFKTSKFMQTARKCTASKKELIEMELEKFKNVPVFITEKSSQGLASVACDKASVNQQQPVSKYGMGFAGRQTTPKRKNENCENDPVLSKTSEFRSAKEQLILNQKKNQASSSGEHSGGGFSVKKSLGARPRVPGKNKFIPPSSNNEGSSKTVSHSGQQQSTDVLMEDPRLQGIDQKIVDLISNEIMHVGNQVEWDDIAGLDFVKDTIDEIIIWPMLRPDLFTKLRRPAKGILLFGPPGTGKTMIGKCIANKSGATFFNISASSLTSKWIGEGEKMIRGLFAVAACHQPSVIFIDEIDSLLTQRSDTEHESSRRMKTEFLVQLDGAGTLNEDQILVIGATNRPQELDEAAQRRLEKRLYIPLPDVKARRQIMERLLNDFRNNLTSNDFDQIVLLTEGYSGADMTNLCKDAAMCPLRSLKRRKIDFTAINMEDVPPISFEDFEGSVKRVRPTVKQDRIKFYEEWNKQFGCSDL